MIKRNRVIKTKQWHDFSSRRKEKERRGSNPMQRYIRLLCLEREWRDGEHRLLLFGNMKKSWRQVVWLDQERKKQKKRIQGSSEDTSVTLHPCKFKQATPLKKVHMIYPWVLHFCNSLNCHVTNCVDQCIVLLQSSITASQLYMIKVLNIHGQDTIFVICKPNEYN